MMTMDFPIPIDNLISININAIMKCTLTFLARSLATSRLSLVRLFKPWPYSCWNVALFDFKMQLVITIPLVVLRIHVLENQQAMFNELSKDAYHELEQLMNVQERVFARHLLVRMCGAAAAKQRFGITNTDVVAAKVTDARARFDAANGGCVETVRKLSHEALVSPKKGGRVAWVTKPHVAAAFVDEVKKTVFIYVF